MRAPFQILVFPFMLTDSGEVKYCLFKRKDLGVWQGIAGGGEDAETPVEAAKRETKEESGISNQRICIKLESIGYIPTSEFKGNKWEKGLRSIPEYSFGIEAMDTAIRLTEEHSEYQWFSFTKAIELLEWDSNKIALEELNKKLLRLQ